MSEMICVRRSILDGDVLRIRGKRSLSGMTPRNISQEDRERNFRRKNSGRHFLDL